MTRPPFPTIDRSDAASAMPCNPAISSHSLGRAWVHDLPSKLDKAAKYGFDIELFYEDLEYMAKSLPGGLTRDNLFEAARLTYTLCRQRHIRIVCLQPFMHYEGLRSRIRHEGKVEEMKFWLQLARILHTSVISIPSTCLPESEVSGDIDHIVSDLREVADLAATEGVELAYEALAWGTHVNTWEQAWEVVQKVDRENFGICLDTFNIAARVYADPTSSTRKTENAAADLEESMQRLVRTVDVAKIVYVQVVDAEYLASPLVEGHEYYNPEQHPRMSWSRNFRLFYGEQKLGAYLPIQRILKAIVEELGFEGCISAELFNKSLVATSPSVPEEHARRAFVAWCKIANEFDLPGGMIRPSQARLELHRSGETRCGQFRHSSPL